MISKYRKEFNRLFSDDKYREVYKKAQEIGRVEPGFRISESPVFLSNAFKEKLNSAAQSIIEQIKAMSTEELLEAVPEGSLVPNDSSHPHFLTIDFGICEGEDGKPEPQLIELQAFPSLYGYNFYYEEILKEVFPFLQEFERFYSLEDFKNIFHNVVIGNENPENVILMELFPEKQKTNIDFYATERLLGLTTVGLTEVKKEGRKLYYEKNGKRIPINRIYNRVIFDELYRYKDLKTNFEFSDDLDVEWVTHPNWFFKVSKYILPKLKHPYVPKSYFLNEFPAGENLENYVLKPLFSFAGAGINVHPKEEDLAKISDKENYIMQRKVQYGNFFEDINGEFSKGEIRLLMLWDPKDNDPKWVTNLVRMTKAELVNVDFNKKDAIWIGSSIGFFGDED